MKLQEALSILRPKSDSLEDLKRAYREACKWKLAKHKIVSIPLQKAIKERIIEVFNKYPGEAGAIS